MEEVRKWKRGYKSAIITFQGETRTLSEWAKLYKISKKVLRCRIKLNWSMEKALNTPVKRQGYKRPWWEKIETKNTFITLKKERDQEKLKHKKLVENKLKTNNVVQKWPHKRRRRHTVDKPLIPETSIPENWEIKVDNGIDVYHEIMLRRCNKSITKSRYKKFRNVFEDIELHINSKPLEAEIETEIEKDAIIILRGGKIYNEIMERYQLECA